MCQRENVLKDSMHAVPYTRKCRVRCRRGIRHTMRREELPATRFELVCEPGDGRRQGIGGAEYRLDERQERRDRLMIRYGLLRRVHL